MYVSALALLGLGCCCELSPAAVSRVLFASEGSLTTLASLGELGSIAVGTGLIAHASGPSPWTRSQTRVPCFGKADSFVTRPSGKPPLHILTRSSSF